ncbi:MAG: dicarboxylate/amino acid:cation symporter, partial [Halieaceae bacterium]|nr:dicarboxylate/amino acid:cation symporter [Halieaceae bacterium]
MSLTNRILIGMLGGILLGSLLNLIAHGSSSLDPDLRNLIENGLVNGVFDVIGQIFVASLKLLVVPLVFVSLVCGSTSLGDSARMGPIAAKTLLFYLATTAIAVTSALLVAVMIRPGSGVEVAGTADFTPTEPPPLKDVIINIFPDNPVQAMAEGEMLQIIVFALLFGYAISKAGDAGKRLGDFFSDLEAVIMKMVGVLMELAPIGVFALLARLFADMGLGAILDLAAYFLTVLGVLLIHGLFTYSVLLKVLTGLPPQIMWRKMRSVWAFAFSTASSGATLPITMRTVEKKLGVHNSVA